jgi:hypothetical protein
MAGMPIAGSAVRIAFKAVPSAVPDVRLNEIVTAGNWL